MKRTAFLLLTTCLLFVLFPASHNALALDTDGMLGKAKTAKTAVDQTGLTTTQQASQTADGMLGKAKTAKTTVDQTGFTTQQQASQTADGMLGKAKTTKTVTDQTGLTQQTGQMLNLNSASADQLTQLPGIGPKTAAAIVDKRNQLGGKFNSLDQLLDVKGIGQKKLAKIKPLLSL